MTQLNIKPTDTKQYLELINTCGKEILQAINKLDQDKNLNEIRHVARMVGQIQANAIFLQTKIIN